MQGAKSPLWDSISKALDITAEQSEKMQQGRQRIKALLSHLQESLNLVTQLREAITKRHAHYDAQCGGVAQIATPKQVTWLCIVLPQRVCVLHYLSFH